MKVHSAFVQFIGILTCMLVLSTCSGGGGGGTPPATPPFSQADLVGTWYVSLLQSSPTLSGSSEPGWIRGIATVSSSGSISIPTIETNLGTGAGPIGVVWTIDPWTGIISESGASSNPDFHGKLAANKQLIVGTATNLNSAASPTTVQLRVIQKMVTSVSYTISDIADKTFMVHQIESGAGKEWMYADGSTGPVFSGTTTTVTLATPVTSSSGTLPGFTPGAFSIDLSGLVSLDTNPSLKGILSPDKTYMVATETDPLDSRIYRLTVVQFKNAAPSYSLSDLAGTWRIHGILGAGYWLYSTATLNAAGIGTITDQHDSAIGATAPYATSLTIAPTGVVSEPTNSTSHGFLSLSKDLLVSTQTITEIPSSFMAIIVK